MTRIYDPSGSISIESADYPLIDPDSIRKALVDVFTRPWRLPMNPAERDGYTRAVICGSGSARGSYRAERWRALERSTTSSTGWAYRYFDAAPAIGRACSNGDTGALTRAVQAQSDENRRRAQQWVLLTSNIADLTQRENERRKGAIGRAMDADEPAAAAPARQPGTFGGVSMLQSAAARAKLAGLQRKLSASPQGQRWARRLEDSPMRANLSARLREVMAARNGVPVDVVDPQAVAEVVDAAAVDQAEALVTTGGVSPEWQALLDTVYPLASAERYAELLSDPTLPVEVYNLVNQYANRFQAAGLD